MNRSPDAGHFTLSQIILFGKTLADRFVWNLSDDSNCPSPQVFQIGKPALIKNFIGRSTLGKKLFKSINKIKFEQNVVIN